MRRTLKLAGPLAISILIVSLLHSTYQILAERRSLRSELEVRSAIVAKNLAERIEFTSSPVTATWLYDLLNNRSLYEHVSGAAFYDRSGRILASSPEMLPPLTVEFPEAQRATEANHPMRATVGADEGARQLYILPLQKSSSTVGAVVVATDPSSVDARLIPMARASLLSAVAQTILITVFACLLFHFTFMAPLSVTTNWLRRVRYAISENSPPPPKGEIFEQIHSEVQHLAKDLNSARAAAQEEAQLRESQSTLWTPDRLRVSLQNRLAQNSLFVVSNREPYMHVMNGNDKLVQLLIPASGVVSALEPVLQACHGTWVANGSGNADRTAVDSRDRLRVPPTRPSYTLRRVWLNAQENRGYYEGFSNEGLWPLCHIAHTRPLFRPEDWKEYQRINRRFADAVVEEMSEVASPVVLAQDFHLALLPRMVKELRPDARVATFWHIPWPNPEAFGICPWQAELLDGLLGADLIGFQIQPHCSNFLATVDHVLEALTDWDRFEVYRQGHVTRVRSSPISIASPQQTASAAPPRSAGQERAALCEELGIEASLLGVGVDRVDYTKGLLERFRGIERFLDDSPAYKNRFSFIQIGAPSRTDIPRYRQFLEEVTAEAERINARFQAGKWKPIVLLRRHHSHEEIDRYFRAASLLMVTSLHDGMNLVAKEFIASRSDERGALILSTFTGAAQELTDALLVNPYDVDQLARTIRQALELTEEQQQTRMERLRRVVAEHNVYRWAANLIADLGEIRISTPEHRQAMRAR